MLPDWFFNTVGLLGPILFTWAYLMLSLGTWNGNMVRTHVANLGGAVAILISLARFWNLSIFVLEIAWAAISLYGMWRARRA